MHTEYYVPEQSKVYVKIDNARGNNLLTIVLGIRQQGGDVEHNFVALINRVQRVSACHVTCK